MSENNLKTDLCECAFLRKEYKISDHDFRTKPCDQLECYKACTIRDEE